MINELLYKKYISMMKDHLENDLMTQDEFASFVKESLEGMHYVAIDNDSKKGFLYYGTWEEDDVHHFIVLPYGYYAEDEKTMVKLFQKWSQEAVRDGKYEFSVNLFLE